MRAMIVAAGLGSRLQPLTNHRAKPAVPVRGLPLIAYNLELLYAAGAEEVVINLHHLPETLREAAERSRPEGLRIHFSHEPELLHTGGAIARVADFLRESDPCVVVGGDMILDVDLPAFVAGHRASGREVSMVLAEHPRMADFGSIGLDAEGRLARVASRFDLGGESQAGVYTWLNVISPRAFETLPSESRFNHLDDWWAPAHAERRLDVGGAVLGPSECAWQPVGTPEEYLEANLHPLPLRYLDADRRAEALGVRLEAGSVVGAGARLGEGCTLEDAVVWDGETVPAGARLSRGVFAEGRFHPVPKNDREAE